MNVLALDLSTALGSIARVDGSSEIMREFPSDRQNSSLFFDHLQELYSSTRAPKAIVVGLGPGSYAGVRIAIATAIGLQAASGARLVGIASICALNTTSNEYDVIGDARRQSFFHARILNRECKVGPSLCSAEELRQRLREQSNVPTFSSQALTEFPEAVIAYPSALELARLGEGRPNDERPLEPIYLREPHITVPKSRALVG